MKAKIKTILVTFCILLSLSFDYVKYLEVGNVFGGGNYFFKIGYIGTIVLFILLYRFIKQQEVIKSKVVSFLSALLSFFMVFGASFMQYGTSSLIFASFYNFLVCLIIFLGYFFLFRYVISLFYKFLDNYKESKWSNKILNVFKEHPFIISLIVIILCWIPYFIAYYPVILSPDPSFQIKQFFGIRSKYNDYVVMLDDNVLLTNHHPVAHTVLIGGCLKLGHMIGNDNLGLFFYSLIQIAVLSGVLAYTIKYMVKDMSASWKMALGALAIYALVPMYGMYAISAVKDVLFTSFIILYIILLHKVLTYKGDFKISDIIKLVLVMLLVILFRNNGLHVIILSFPFLILAVKKYRKQLSIVFIIVLALSTCYSKVLLPSLKITPGSIREALSVPFQQTARYVKYYGDELSDKDKEVIDKVLIYDTLSERYDPELADDVKNKFNKYATNDDLKEYFKVWFKGLLKHPITYINATINNTYGFFYPEKTSWYLHTKLDDTINEDGFDYHYNNLNSYRNDVSKYIVNYPKIPVIGLICNIGFNTWMVFILVGYVIKNKNYKKLILYLPALISILVCIVGPANTYFRYAMPYMFAMPLMISFVLQRKNIV